MEVPLNASEAEYVAAQIRSGRAANGGDLLREALQLLMEREADERREYEKWRERTRGEIDEAYEESFHEEGFDGPAVFEQLRLEIESRRRVSS